MPGGAAGPQRVAAPPPVRRSPLCSQDRPGGRRGPGGGVPAAEPALPRSGGPRASGRRLLPAGGHLLSGAQLPARGVPHPHAGAERAPGGGGLPPAGPQAGRPAGAAPPPVAPHYPPGHQAGQHYYQPRRGCGPHRLRHRPAVQAQPAQRHPHHGQLGHRAAGAIRLHPDRCAHRPLRPGGYPHLDPHRLLRPGKSGPRPRVPAAEGGAAQVHRLLPRRPLFLGGCPHRRPHRKGPPEPPSGTAGRGSPGLNRVRRTGGGHRPPPGAGWPGGGVFLLLPGAGGAGRPGPARRRNHLRRPEAGGAAGPAGQRGAGGPLVLYLLYGRRYRRHLLRRRVRPVPAGQYAQPDGGMAVPAADHRPLPSGGAAHHHPGAVRQLH